MKKMELRKIPDMDRDMLKVGRRFREGRCPEESDGR